MLYSRRRAAMNRVISYLGLFASIILFSLLRQADAVVPARSQVQPTGCTGTPHGITVSALNEWGLVPFSTVLEVTDTYGIVNSVAWDLDGDGVPDAYGSKVRHRFVEPVNDTVRVRIQTARHGTIFRNIVISGYSGLMSITFDDGANSVFTHGLPVLQATQVPATAYIVLDWVGRPAYMNWEWIDSLQAAGWEIGSHSVNHPHLTDLDDSTLHFELHQSQAELRLRGFPAKQFAAPYADVDGRVIAAIRQYYASNRVAGCLNPDLRRVKAYRLKSDFSHSWVEFDHYRDKMDSAAATGGWYILSNHIVLGSGGSCSWCITQQMLSDIIDYAEVARLKIVTIGEGLAACEVKGMPDDLMGPDSSVDGPGSGTGAAAGIQVHTPNPNRLGLPITISYRLPGPAWVRLDVFSPTGRLVASLLDEHRPAGLHHIAWNDGTTCGPEVAPGIYFLRLEAGNRAATCKAVLVQ
jgi:peptidoglycan/xylan/chitin deacetylase (PgdA/CDA1 family)